MVAGPLGIVGVGATRIEITFVGVDRFVDRHRPGVVYLVARLPAGELAGLVDRLPIRQDSAAIGGFNRIHAVLGTSDDCIAAHPSDMAVAMAALGAHIETRTADGSGRTLSLDELYRPPGHTPHLETNLAEGELIVAVVLPPPPRGAQIYRKVRDRASYAFALVSVAAVLAADASKIHDARVAFGSLAPKPWRSIDAELALIGQLPSREIFETAAEAGLKGARGYGHNDFKIALARRMLVAVLEQLAGRR